MCVRISFFFFYYFLYWHLHWFSPPLQIVHVEFFLVCVESVSSHYISSLFGRDGGEGGRKIQTHFYPLSPTTPQPLPHSSPLPDQSRAALHLSASIATLAFCSAPVCGFTPVGQAGQGCVGGCPWVQSPCGGCGTLGTFGETPQPPTWGGGGEVAMEAAMGLPPLPLLKLSEAFSRENMVNASGKLGGVAGVLAGVHIWGWRGKNID